MLNLTGKGIILAKVKTSTDNFHLKFVFKQKDALFVYIFYNYKIKVYDHIGIKSTNILKVYDYT